MCACWFEAHLAPFECKNRHFWHQAKLAPPMHRSAFSSFFNRALSLSRSLSLFPPPSFLLSLSLSLYLTILNVNNASSVWSISRLCSGVGEGLLFCLPSWPVLLATSAVAICGHLQARAPVPSLCQQLAKENCEAVKESNRISFRRAEKAPLIFLNIWTSLLTCGRHSCGSQAVVLTRIGQNGVRWDLVRYWI